MDSAGVWAEMNPCVRGADSFVWGAGLVHGCLFPCAGCTLAILPPLRLAPRTCTGKPFAALRNPFVTSSGASRYEDTLLSARQAVDLLQQRQPESSREQQ